ncbi:MAG: hypothetical protein KC910_32765 [Candidatus Eremiobacteraeota bacterium]|nr:hypothetical protein [Candidatus Eremiobacteraeota bacterium]
MQITPPIARSFSPAHRAEGSKPSECRALVPYQEKPVACVPQEKVEISEPATGTELIAPPAPDKKKSRGLRKLLIKAAGWGMAGFNALCGIPEGIAVGLGVARGKSKDQIRGISATTYALSNTVVGGAAGWLVGGPVGMICGAAAGYVAGNIANHLESRSHSIDTLLDNVTDHVEKANKDVAQKNGVGRATRAVVVGAWEGMKTNFELGKTAGSILAAGAADGVDHVIEEMKADKPAEEQPEKPAKDEPMGIGKALKMGLGVLCGATGVLINAPGGAIIGALESLKGPDEKERVQIAKPLMLFATNIGKVIPGAVVAGAIGGPVGVAVGTAVGVITASLTSIIDGKYGFNRSVVKEVDKAVSAAHGEDIPRDNLRVFYRAGKGAVVGAMAGLKEGWELGYKSGVDMAEDLASTPKEAVEQEEEDKEPPKLAGPTNNEQA